MLLLSSRCRLLSLDLSSESACNGASDTIDRLRLSFCPNLSLGRDGSHRRLLLHG